ncbi:helix-turn-helix transcriptional regulator [Pedobacter sp.]
MHFIPPPEENTICYSGELPEEYSLLQLPFADIEYTTGDFGTVISQHINGDSFSIWKHDFLIKRSVQLYPYVPVGIHTLNYMLKGNIPCELIDIGKIDLVEGTYNLYYVPPVKQKAWLSTGEFCCVHIDLKPDYLQELATEFGMLNEFLKFSTAGNAKVVRAKHYPMDGNIKLILMDIIGCKRKGVTRNMYLHSRIFDLLLIFSRDLLHEEVQVLRIDDTLLGEVKAFLEENYHRPITICELCRRFGVNQVSLSRRFKLSFEITIHIFLMNLRMKKAVQLLKEEISIKTIAEKVGYSETAAFSKAFKSRFNQSPSQFRKKIIKGTNGPE